MNPVPNHNPGPDPVLEVENLKVYFSSRDGIVRAVDGLSFSLNEGETLGIVGESGCGKSVSAMSVLRLIPSPPSVVAGGEIRYRGTDLLKISEQRMQEIRGNEISMIFQDPMTSLNPVLTIGEQIAETVMLHQKLGMKGAWERAVEMLHLVNIPEPQRRADEYPHQFSGGMRQRAMIALALACNPKVLIADEPTTALDVTIQAQIIDLMLKLKEEFGTAIVMITHDLGVVAETCGRVVVMYAGRKVEEAGVAQLFAEPLHPYTQGLLACIPKLDTVRGAHRATRQRLAEITGMVPSLKGELTGCSFAPRCPKATPFCREEEPHLEELRKGHLVACWEARRDA
jgi:peptide/nickel transport system ATP-binding protein